MDDSISALFELARGGNASARESLVMRFLGRFDDFSSRFRLKRINLHDDAYQDCWFALNDAVNGNGVPDDVEKYLSRVIVNSIKRTIKNANTINTKHNAPIDVVAMDKESLEMIACSDDCDAEMLNAAVDALQQLPASFQMIVTERHKGESFRDIARTQGITVSVAQSRYNAAINVIRENANVRSLSRDLDD